MYMNALIFCDTQATVCDSRCFKIHKTHTNISEQALNNDNVQQDQSG